MGSAPRASKPALCIYRFLCCSFLVGKRVRGSCSSLPSHGESLKTIPCSAAHRECPPGKQTCFVYLPGFVLFFPRRQACGGLLYLAAHPWGETQIWINQVHSYQDQPKKTLKMQWIKRSERRRCKKSIPVFWDSVWMQRIVWTWEKYKLSRTKNI